MQATPLAASLHDRQGSSPLPRRVRQALTLRVSRAPGDTGVRDGSPQTLTGKPWQRLYENRQTGTASMTIISRGFHGRRPPEGTKLPPGQYEATGFPVLSAGPTPHVEKSSWELSVTTEAGRRHTWDWAALMALPSESPTVDLHCVTKWSKFGTEWRGVSLDVLLADVETAAEHALVTSYGATPQTYRSRICSMARRGSRTATTAMTSRPNTVGQPGCSYPTYTCGSLPSGCAGSNCRRATRLAFGRASATTTTETHGENSGTRETRRPASLACR